MSHQYVVRPKVDKTGKVEIVRYYGVPVISSQISTKQLAGDVADRSSLTRGDVYAAISELGEVMKFWLEAGCSVQLDGIGTFYVSAKSQGCDSPEECTPGKVKAERLCFRAVPAMRNAVKDIKFQKALHQ